MKAISQSQINLYRNCPHAYELKYRYNREPMMYDPSVMEVGKRVHDTIDHYYKNHYVPEHSEQEILNITYNILKNQWDKTLPASYLLKAWKCLITFAKFEISNHEGGIETKPLTEVKIYSEDLMGIVDYLNLNKQKVIDFKTNTKAYLSYENKLQAIMYQKLIKDKFNINIENFGFVFLFIDSEPKDVWLGDPELKDIEKDLYKYRDKIKESWLTMNFPKAPKNENQCSRCDYRFYCSGKEESKL